MITYLQHNEINKQKWDACIKQSFNGIIYAYSWYLDVVCPNWEALIEDDYKVVMPLTGNKKFGINYLFPPLFTQQLGVFSVNKLDEEIVGKFVDAIPKKYRYFQINLNTFNNFTSTLYQVTNQINCELDLIDSYENNFSRYSDNTKRNIKRAINNQLQLTDQVAIADIVQLFIENKGKTLKKIDYNLFKLFIKICSDREKTKVIGVRTNDNKLCAGAVFVADKGKVIFLFSATNKEAKETGAMSLLIDLIIRENSQRNLILDFEGSNDPNLARFYKSFGSKECIYLQIKSNRLPWYIKWIKK